MELNAEQIKKALDWLDSLVGNSNNSDIAHFTYSLLGILYDTCEELTEENKRLKNRINEQEQRIGAQDMVISELRQRAEKAEHDVERYAARINLITDSNVITDSKVSLNDLVWEAYKKSLQEGIRANTVLISKRLAKVNGFTCFLGNGYGDFPPLICGLEAYVTDELPDEFAFGLVEAPSTQREHYLEEGRKRGYIEAVLTMQERLKEKLEHYPQRCGDCFKEKVDQIAKEMLEGNNDQETDEK